MRKITTLGMLFCAAMISFTSCSKDDDNGGGGVLVEDGMYVVGAGTPLAALNDNGKMTNAKNEANDQKLRPGMYEIYMTVKAGVDGFNIIEKAGAVETKYGPATVADVVLDGTKEDPNETIQLGTFAVNSAKFTVPADGLYHIVLDKTLMTIAIIPVKTWAVRGAATPLGWDGDTEIPLIGSFNATEMVFQATDIKITKGDFKFRYDNAWKVRLSGDTIRVNTNMGGTLAALTPGGDNIVVSAELRGIYTITVKWTLAKGNVFTLTKTADIVQVDYTNYEMGIIGDGFNKAVATPNGWDDNFGNHKPVKVGNVYTWTYDNIDVLATGSFKFRQQMAVGVNQWSGKVIGFRDVVLTGVDAANFVDAGGGDHNITSTVAGVYKIVLSIDASTEIYSLAVTKK